MDYKNKYNDALEKLQEALAPKDGCEISGLTRACIEEIFPELKESEDKKIRNSIIENLKGNMYRADGDYDLLNKQIAWLEKQESVEEIVERCKTSWYNEGKIAGMAEGLSNDEKYQQGWHDAIEKQVPVDKDKVVKGVRRGVATSLINYINANSKGMCLSSMECEDIEDAIVNNKWYKVYGYMKKKLEKQGNKPQGKTALEAIKEEKVDNSNKVETNSAWSEEDETILDNLIYALANDRIGNNRDEYVDWLKSIKERVQPQPKQ